MHNPLLLQLLLHIFLLKIKLSIFVLLFVKIFVLLFIKIFVLLFVKTFEKTLMKHIVLEFPTRPINPVKQFPHVLVVEKQFCRFNREQLKGKFEQLLLFKMDDDTETIFLTKLRLFGLIEEMIEFR